jgi:NAD(P)H-hydrate epimerase
MRAIVTADEMRRLDRAAIDERGIPSATLMERAGAGVARVVRKLLREKRSLVARRVLVLCGPGNNGGDGFVVARHLRQAAIEVDVIACFAPARLIGDAAFMRDAWLAAGGQIMEATDAAALDAQAARFARAGLIVDALFGTGLSRPVEGVFAHAIELCNRSSAIKVAVDVPSGIDTDLGAPLGVCFEAQHTVTFAFPKLGIVGAPGFVHAGAVEVVDIGIDDAMARAIGARGLLLDRSVLDAIAAPEDGRAHKGTHGHVLVIAGSSGKGGAALLPRAALRAGAGLVTLATPVDVRSALEGRVPEVMTVGYDPGDPSALSALLVGRRAAVVGPGMPTDEKVRPALGALLGAAARAKIPVVLDADALNHLAAARDLLPATGTWVMTPHPGEAARLLGRSSAEVERDRLGIARELAAQYHAIAVLKGARTIICAPSGHYAVCPAGSPALGTGGTGDVLAGVIGARLGAGRPTFDAACEGVMWHATAGDLAAAAIGPRGLLAGDVMDHLPQVLSAHRKRAD